MLYVFYGEDTLAARANAQASLRALIEKKQNASVLRFDAETFAVERLPELLYGQGLFVQKYLIVLDGVSEKEEYWRVVLEMLPAIAASENIFFVIEGHLDATSKKKIIAHAHKSHEFVARGKEKPAPSKTFAVGDAFGARNRKLLWLSYRAALDAGHSVEEIHGILFWQVKSILLAHETERAVDAGMRQFPYAKAKRYARLFTKSELQKAIYELTAVYHEARLGSGELAVLLERWILAQSR